MHVHVRKIASVTVVTVRHCQVSVHVCTAPSFDVASKDPARNEISAHTATSCSVANTAAAKCGATSHIANLECLEPDGTLQLPVPAVQQQIRQAHG